MQVAVKIRVSQPWHWDTGKSKYSDDEERLKALYEQASNEEDLEKLSQLIDEILAILEARDV